MGVKWIGLGEHFMVSREIATTPNFMLEILHNYTYPAVIYVSKTWFSSEN